ncbi:hypothetical protein [Halorussus salinisoli]|uniref:hypothetical protein n=1 Tax=Halorussus salinisoli TaxID=2558242 RepID=UPI0010C20078|nr:hypothetical protein [Halorussus salinisoli]
MPTQNKSEGWLSRRSVLQSGATAGVFALGGVAATGATTAQRRSPANTGNKPLASDDNADRVADGETVAQTTDIVGQGADGDVVAEDGAQLWRTPNAILMEVSMPTPTPGEYTYPSAPEDKKDVWWTDEAGDLEAFTLWAFTFNNPGECEDGCSSDDFGDPAGGGVFGVTGHVFDGGTLTLNGMVTTDTETWDGAALARPMEAEVHLAVAPHGAFEPAMLPDQLQTPASPSSIWWVALFDPPA